MSYKYFSKKDVADFHNIDPVVLRRVDELREAMGRPIYITSGYRRGDPNAHGKGLALDIVCPGADLLQFYEEAEKLGFNGLGVYPHWKWHGRQIGGLHVDMWNAGRRWMGVRDPEDGPQYYIKLNAENLKKYLTPPNP